MKSRDEYLESIYKKRDNAAKQRKKQITAFATLVPLCAVVVIGISALSSGFFAEKSADMASPENESIEIQQTATDASTAIGAQDEDFAYNNSALNDYEHLKDIDGFAAAGSDSYDSSPATTVNTPATTFKAQTTAVSESTAKSVATVTRNGDPDFIKEIYTDYEKLMSALDPEEKIMLDFQAPDDYYIITVTKTGNVYYWTDGAVCFGNEWYGIGPENNETIKNLILV